MVTTFTIDREKWLRGADGAGIPTPTPMLLDDQGRRCCLGFYAQACGVSDELMANVPDPSDVGGAGQGAVPPEMGWLIKRRRPVTPEVEMRPSDACNELTWANDNPYTSQRKREDLVIGLFEQRGIKVEFV